MPSKRTRVAHKARVRVTGETGALYRRCKELQPTHRKHLRSKCPRNAITHCALCTEFYEKWRQLDQLLGVMPWQVSPLDAGDECPYPDEPRQGFWRQAKDLRRELERLL